jgi:hypothetical protein
MISINNIKKIAYSAIQNNITSKKDLTNYFRSNKTNKITITSLIKEYEEISKVRSKRNSYKVKPSPSINNRLYKHLKRILNNQIRERNLDVPTGWNTFRARVVEYDKINRIWLITDNYKYHYSNRFGDWWVSGAFICGKDDNQYWACRVPSTCNTINDAIDWLTPAKVKNCIDSNKYYCRQGDIYLVQTRNKSDDVSNITYTRHIFKRFEDGHAELTHPQHKTVVIPKGIYVRSCRQKQLSVGSRRRNGD